MPIYPDDPNGDDWATAVEIGTVPRIDYPFQSIGDITAIIYERDFVQAGDSWAPLALDTADGTYTSAFLFEETEPSEIGAGLVQWQRRFGTVPSAFTAYSYESVTFPGYYDSYATDTNFRSPFPKVVPLKNNYTFLKTADPLTDFAVVAQQLYITNSRGESVSYVGDDTSTTYSTYTGYVSADTFIVVRDAVFRRCYGAGNIWEQIQYQAEAE